MNASGKYKIKDTDEIISYDFDYLVLEGSNAQEKIDNAVSSLGADKVAKDIQRTLKVDANNLAREKAKTTNGHSTRPVMSEDDKLKAKTARKVNAEILEALKAKGLTLADIESM